MSKYIAPPSPFNQLMGFNIDEWNLGNARLSVNVKPEFTNVHGIPHGGFLCSLLDVACSLPGIYCPDPERIRAALTLSLTTSFVGQAKSCELYAVGRITSAGYKIFHSTGEVYDSHHTLLATAQAVFKYSKGSESPEGQLRSEWKS